MLFGFEVAGQRYAEDYKVIRMAAAELRSAVEFSCIMNLQSCVCFAGCGLWSDYQSNKLYCIMDTLMFRVSPASTRNSFGCCELMG